LADLGFFEAGVNARFEVAEVRKDALFELFNVANRATKGLEAEGERTDDVCARYVIET
jgi:hypothetical protein